MKQFRPTVNIPIVQVRTAYYHFVRRYALGAVFQSKRYTVFDGITSIFIVNLDNELKKIKCI